MNVEFVLPQAVPYFNTSATKGEFFMWYPSGQVFWELQTSSGVRVKEGNYVFSQQVMSTWETDQDLITALVNAAPWNI